jgi:hypothetical protein
MAPEVSGGFFTANGGGIYAVNSTGSILGVRISGNTATGKGGGVFEFSSTITFEVAKVIANSAPVDPDVSGAFTFI